MEISKLNINSNGMTSKIENNNFDLIKYLESLWSNANEEQKIIEIEEIIRTLRTVIINVLDKVEDISKFVLEELSVFGQYQQEVYSKVMENLEMKNLVQQKEL